jgi:hypothetical protein
MNCRVSLKSVIDDECAGTYRYTKEKLRAEDGGNCLLRNVRTHLNDHKALNPQPTCELLVYIVRTLANHRFRISSLVRPQFI